MSFPYIIRRHRRLLAILFGLICYSALIAYATPPGTPYTAGETLDPSCAPGASNCYVTVTTAPAGSDGQLQFNDNGVFGASDSLSFDGTTFIVPSLSVSGGPITIPAPTNLTAIQTCADACGYTASGYTHNYRVYSYKTFDTTRIYSATYATLAVPFTDDNSSNSYDITVSWTAAVGGVDGYRILKQDDVNGYNFDAGYDTTDTSIIDDGCGNFCFDGFTLEGHVVTPTSYTSSGLTLSSITSSSESHGNTTKLLSVDSAGEVNLYTQAVSVGDAGVLYSSGLDGTGQGLGANIILGVNAGNGIVNVSGSNFLGNNAGYQATDASYSNFFGLNAGNNATNASGSNFFGISAGKDATNASESNFLGTSAGFNSPNASYSNFFGYAAGSGQSSDASYSNFFGYRAGLANISALGSNNIIIGTNISLPNATSNAINLGGVLFGTGTHNDTLGNTSLIPESGGRIGIGVVSPSYTLQVGNSSISGIVARFQNSTGTCDINPTTTSLSCSSDRTLKKDITPLSDDILSQLTTLTPVTYHWNSEEDTVVPHVGFIAQDVESVFPSLVATDPSTGLKSLNYIGLIPYTIKAVGEIQLQMVGIDDLATPNTFRENILTWFADTANGIEAFFSKKITTEELCLSDANGSTCVTREQLDQFLQTHTPQTTTIQPSPDDASSTTTGTSDEGATDQNNSSQDTPPTQEPPAPVVDQITTEVSQ